MKFINCSIFKNLTAIKIFLKNNFSEHFKIQNIKILISKNLLKTFWNFYDRLSRIHPQPFPRHLTNPTNGSKKFHKLNLTAHFLLHQDRPKTKINFKSSPPKYKFYHVYLVIFLSYPHEIILLYSIIKQYDINTYSFCSGSNNKIKKKKWC